MSYLTELYSNKETDLERLEGILKINEKKIYSMPESPEKLEIVKEIIIYRQDFYDRTGKIYGVDN